MDTLRYIVIGDDGTPSAPIAWTDLFDRAASGEIGPETSIIDTVDNRRMLAQEHAALAALYQRLAKEQRKAGRGRLGGRRIAAAASTLPESSESSESSETLAAAPAPPYVPLASEGAYAGQHEHLAPEFPWPTLNPLAVKVGSIVLVVFVLWWIFGIPIQDKVTLAKYKAIYPGMTYRKCVEIIGCEGKETYRGDVMHARDRLIEWRNLDGSVAMLQFEDDRLIIKSQERLR